MHNRSSVLFPILSSIISLIMASIYMLFRYPIETDCKSVLLVLSVSLFMLNAPFNLFLISKKIEFNFYSLNIWVIVLILLLFILFGLLNFSLPFLLFVFLGVATFSITIFYFIKSIRQHRLLGWSIFFTTLFCIWLAGIIWDGKYLSPLFLEKIAFSRDFDTIAESVQNCSV